MKIFSVILSLYVLLLMTVPCCADDDCGNIVSTQQSDQHNQNNEENKCGNCSPFMTCGNCVGFAFTIVEPLSFKQTNSTLIETTLFFITDSDFLFNYSSNIWQPPKLV